MNSHKNKGGGLPSLVTNQNETGKASLGNQRNQKNTQQSTLPDSHKTQATAVTAQQYLVQQRIQNQGKPQRSTNLEAQLNHKLHRQGGGGGQQQLQGSELGGTIQMSDTVDAEVRPATTKHLTGGRMLQTHDMGASSLPSVGQSGHSGQAAALGQIGHARNQMKQQFQTLENMAAIPGEEMGMMMHRDDSQMLTADGALNMGLNTNIPTQMLQAPNGAQNSKRRGNKRSLIQSSEAGISKRNALKSTNSKTNATPHNNHNQGVNPQQQQQNMGSGMGSRFRVAVPMQYQDQTKSTYTKQRIASNSFWNQVSKNMSKVNGPGNARSHKDGKSHASNPNTLIGLSDGNPIRDQELTSLEMQRRIKQYQGTLTSKIKDQNNHSKPFSFLTNIGGKDTTHEGFTLRTGPDPSKGPVLSAASALLISSSKGGKAALRGGMTYLGADEKSDLSNEQLAIFTDMNVDKLGSNSKTMPKPRVLYLNASASNKSLVNQQQRLANSKSGVQLDPLPKNSSRKHLIQSASIDSFQKRPVSGISKSGSQSRFRQSQNQFSIHQDGRSYYQQDNQQHSARPNTGYESGNVRQAHQINEQYSEEDNIDGNIDEVDGENDITQDGHVGDFCQQLMVARPTTAFVGSQEPEDQLPFPELFDRSERTYAATFAKYGDLSYFTPVQRIGTYMEYEARLKKRHLMDLIAYIKTSKCQIKVDDENDASLGIHAQDFMDHCLFHGLMPEQESPVEEQLSDDCQLDAIVIDGTNAHDKPRMVKAYNPLSSRKVAGFDFQKVWSEKLLKQVQISILRMMHYVENPDSIRNDELSKYKKEWMKNALDLVPDYLLSTFPVAVKLLFHDVFQNYIRAMKTAIMDYILRSPDERKRLHILTLPHQVMTASENQAQHGGYSIVEYAGTHQRKNQAEYLINIKLITYNVVVSQLFNWWQEFRKFKLVDFSNLRQVVKERDLDRDSQEGNPILLGSPSNALDIDNFLAFQEAMLEKTVALMKHVWHRGAITIIKKFKMLRSKEQAKELVQGNAAKSQWTYAGYQTYPTDLGFPIESQSYDKLEKTLDQVRDFTYVGGTEPGTKMDQYQEYCLRTACVHQNVLLKLFRVAPGFRHDAVIDDYCEDTSLDNLVDIRESDAYIAFVSMVGGFTNYEENGYDVLSKEYKRELKYAAGNLMKVQLRQMVDDSVNTLYNFFRGFKTFQQLKQKVTSFKPLRVHVQTPHNYLPTPGGKKSKEDQAAKNAQMAKDTGNERLAKQLQQRKTIDSNNAARLQQKQIFSNAVTDQPKLNWPDFMDLQDHVNPIFRLELLLGFQNDVLDDQNRKSHHFDETLEFNKSDEQILFNFEAYFENLVTCFNEFNRPEFCKIKEYNQKKYEVELKDLEDARRRNREDARKSKPKYAPNQDLQEAFKKSKNASVINPKTLDFDRLLYSKDFDAPYNYERYMGRIKVKEAPSDVLSKGLIDQESTVDNVFQKDTVSRKIEVASMKEEFFKKHRRDMLKVLRDHLYEVKRVRELFDQFRPIYRSDMQRRVRDFISRPQNSLEMMTEYSQFLGELRRYRSIAWELPERVSFPMFEVGIALVKEEIQSRIEKYMISILWKFECDLKVRSMNICETFEKISVKYKERLTTAEEVVAMEQYKNNLQLDMSQLQRNLTATRKCLFFLICQSEYKEILTDGEGSEAVGQDGYCLTYVDEMLAWPNKLNNEMEIADEIHAQQRATVEKEVFKKKKEFDDRVVSLNKEVQMVLEWTKLDTYRTCMETVHSFHAKKTELEEVAKEISQEEQHLFGNKISDFHQLHSTARFFEPYYELWTRIDEIMKKKQNWQKSKLEDIDADEVAMTVKESLRSLQRLQKDFSSSTQVKDVLINLKSKIKQVEEWMPTIEALCNRALQPRHWSKIKEVTGLTGDQVNFETTDLDGVIQCNINEVLPQLAEISENAKKESRLEDMLRSMKKEWEGIHFEITNYKDCNVPILVGNTIEEMQTKLDEDVLISQSIKNSPAVLPLLEDARQWERTMMFTQDIIEIWLRVQQSYIYLYPIFNSAGIQDEVKSLLDSDGFATVDRAWQRIMTQLKGDTLALNLNKIEGLETILRESNNQLENITKNLNEYLEAKRKYFSRFYFLSNEDLIEILGESQKPKNIQKHLKKCFEGINKVHFRAIRGADPEMHKDEITQLISKEDEKINLIKTIHPYEYDGKVEEWLYELELQMKASVQHVVHKGLRDFPRISVEDAADHLSQSTSNVYQDRIRWLKNWQSQVILTVSQIEWTQQVEESLITYSMLVKLFKQSQAQLNQIVEMVREKLNPLTKMTLSSLIVQNVHSRDLIENLARKRINDLEDFEWISQMRYYFLQPEQSTADLKKQRDPEEDEVTGTVEVRMINTKLTYCNEFLGNTGRLVITQLTDRCYRTLMSALQLDLGGAPEGPAGTGKTETTKDLAKAIGVYCIVFNCADGLNAKAMAKFFKGLASGGVWSCFDEFNRIELEVLSVIAQQILEIQRAKKQGLNKFQFDGATIRLLPTANIFITMNPGYAGRSVLPDNLKALFRPVAMMVPEYVAIAEISLYSYGFFESRSLAKKIVQTYRLCSEQLSTQYHYDYGMRAVKSVLTAAKNLKNETSKRVSRIQTKLGNSVQDSSVIDNSSASNFGYNHTQMSTEETEEVLILKSIMDVNMPKFLAEDIPLFEGIINDLFPGVDLPPPSYADLQKCASTILKKNNFIKRKKFMEKIIQLYDMIKCRHGLMLVGPANSGKTTTYRTLSEALNLVSKEAPSFEEKEVETYVINPKSITLAQLYGNYDAISQEFTDGVLGSIFRYCSYTKPNVKRRWIVFDGPVDAKWIENMNTVLDDNKRLCLMNSEIIQMTDSMNMLFETHDLSKASPATISRCGMVYMAEDSFGGSLTLLKSWMITFEKVCKLGTITAVSPDFLPKRLVKLFELIFQALLEKVQKTCSFIMPASENQITQSMLRIMTIMTHKDTFCDRIHDPSVKQDEITQRFDMIFQYAVMWSVGALVDDASQRKFFILLKEKISEIHKVDNKQFRIERTFQIPDQGLPPTNFFVDGVLWLSWKDVLNRTEGNMLAAEQQNLNQQEIIVPTTETMKQKHILRMFVNANKPILFVGSTGTGKTIAVSQFLKELQKDKFDALTICFSAKSSANHTQKQIEEKLVLRKRRHLGPSNNKRMAVFIDDLNMPTVEKEGAQPPIELLRQWMDHKQWYDYADNQNPLVKISDIVLVGAMCPPAGGKNPVTPRFSRHFNIVSCPNFDKNVMSRIFYKIIDQHIRREGIMGTDTAKTLKQVVDASIDVFNFARENLRPTPAKAHYLFNLRDVTRVIFGLQMMKTFVHGSKAKLVRLWVHECGRVFSDRLNDSTDIDKFFNQLYNSSRDCIKEDMFTCLKEIIPEKHYAENVNMERNPIMMSEYLKFTDLVDNQKAANVRNYDEIDYEKEKDIKASIEDQLLTYNATSQRPMNLVLFDYAIMHLLRICRILKMHKGNALLIGVGGSGRQSLSYLASHLMDHELLQPEQSKNYSQEQWAEDMKRILYRVGCDLKKTTFLLTDNQLKASFMLEDVNNLLNQYEIPGLFGPDDRILMTEKVRINAKKEGNIQLYNHGTNEEILDFFLSKVQENLHIILAMSPKGGVLTERIRNFPSLVNCCTLDWFFEWPTEALNAVAFKMMEEAPFEDDIKAKIVQATEIFHTEANELSNQFMRETSRQNYVTPTSFLDLMNVFQALLDKQRNYLYEKKLSYENGVKKLMQQQEEVIVMQHDINDKQPKLEEMEVNTEHLMKELQEKAVNEVEPKRELIREEEQLANIDMLKAQDIQIDCQNNLTKAMPILNQAKAALDTIKSAHINEIKILQNPPPNVKLVLHAVCVMLDRKVEKTPKKDNPKQLEENWWYTAQKFMNEKDFMSQLQTIDKDNIPHNIMGKIKNQFLTNDNFKPNRVAHASFAAKGLCEWIIKLKEYDEINRLIQPKRLALQNAQASYQQRMQELAMKQDDLKQVELQYEQLQDKLQAEKDIKKNLQMQIQLCEIKLERAKQLLSGLSGEKERWLVSSEEIEVKLTTVVPDMILSSAIIAYLGSFTQVFRKQALESWLYQMYALSLNTLENFSLERVLGQPVQIRKWQMSGLPVDSFSCENGIMMQEALKWPLMIDPQGQANRWIKNMEMDKRDSGLKLMILKPSDTENFVQRFEQALRMGLPLLLESVGEDLDPILDPILLKQIFKVGGIKQIKFGDTNIDYADEFKLYMTTRHANPHYYPELTTKVQLINFMITFEGLSEQLLNLVVRKENMQLDEEHEHLILTQYENQNKMQQTEDLILKVLKDAKGDILDDENAINILNSSQQLSEEIAKKQVEAKITEQRLTQARQAYTPIADHSAMLFFLVSKLDKVEVMYQYSLSWFIQLFSQAVDKSREEDEADDEEGEAESVEDNFNSAHKSLEDKKTLMTGIASPRGGAVFHDGGAFNKGLSIEAQNLRQRVSLLINYFTLNLYSNVCRSIFEKDKLLFSFLLTAKIRESQGKLSNVQYSMLVETMTGLENPLCQTNVCKQWLPNHIWNKLCTYSHRDSFFDPLIKNFQTNEEGWRTLYESEIVTDDLFPANDQNISGKWSPFMKLLILKAIRPDKLGQAVQQYVHQEMGQEFLSPPIFDIQKSFEDSNSGTPLIFILPGTDPLQQLISFAMTKKKYETMKSISLGQNQGLIAEKVITEARKVGSWVLLQNCHLYPSWMPKLEQICEQMEMKSSSRAADSSHSSFRLWLTSYPSEVFPSTVLQSGIKMTNEPPIGLKSNMLGSYKTEPLSDTKFFDGDSPTSSGDFRKIAFGLTMFHAILLQRCNYGPLGWNQNHQFTVSDLQISMHQLHDFTKKYDSVPFSALKYLIGQCNYGGRVTESADQRVLMALLEDFLSEKVLGPEYAYCEDDKVGSLYKFPFGNDAYQTHIDMINSMPTEELPQIFGFHPNADISKNQLQARFLCELLLQIGDVDGAKSRKAEDPELLNEDEKKKANKKRTIMSRATEETKKPEDDLLQNIFSDITANLPTQLVDMDTVTTMFPVKRENSMNTVLTQELIRFNRLLATILKTLEDLQAAQKGQILMTDQLLATRIQLIQGFVPESWLEVSYPTLKPLASYVRDLNMRIQSLERWVNEQKQPEVFWLSGFFFTQSFLTAILQNYARKYRIEIDALQFEFRFTNMVDPTDHETEVFQMQMAQQRGLDITVPEDGALISGLYYEGCRWDFDNHCIGEQHSKQLFSKVPIIHLNPMQARPVSPETLKTKTAVGQDNYSVSTRQNQRELNTVNTNPTAMSGPAARKNFASKSDVPSDVQTRVAQTHVNYTGNAQIEKPQTQGSKYGGASDFNAQLAALEAGHIDSGPEMNYECPLYRTSARYGTLLTTGHSTNFIIMVSTPLPLECGEGDDSVKTKSAKDSLSSNHWIKRGAAMVCSLST